MFLMLIGILIGVWVLYSGFNFYRTIDWTEKAEPSPDLRGMHKKQAELQHIQELLEEACAEGKLSNKVIEEFNRYCEAENAEMVKVETAWKAHRKSNSQQN